MSINPFFAAILTAEAAADGRGYLLVTTSSIGPLNNCSGLSWMVSPWLIYVIFYLALALLSVRLTTRRICQISGI